MNNNIYTKNNTAICMWIPDRSTETTAKNIPLIKIIYFLSYNDEKINTEQFYLMLYKLHR